MEVETDPVYTPEIIYSIVNNKGVILSDEYSNELIISYYSRLGLIQTNVFDSNAYQGFPVNKKLDENKRASLILMSVI